jgi:hypothetical protein
MHRFILAILFMGMLPVSAVAQIQPGSAGGAIGKTDKSISGEDNAAELHPSTHARARSPRPVERGASGQSSAVSLAGRWRWDADCSPNGLWLGQFDIVETSRGQFSGSFAGTSWHDVGTITDGHINGASITFTRTNVPVTQHWKGQLAGGRMKGTLSGNANCSWEASRK